MSSLKSPIIGKSEVTAEQMAKFLLANNPNPKIAMDVKEFCKAWLQEGEIEGVRGDIAFCQALHETGWFKFGGLVLPEQNNFAGIGATNNSAVGKGAWFVTAREGIMAVIQHLKAYASKEPLKQICVDPRFSLVTRGIAPNFEDLGGRWAVPGYSTTKYKSFAEAYASNATYGQMILALYEALKLIKVEPEHYDLQKAVVYYGDIDAFSAVMVSQYNQCPMVRKVDFDKLNLKVKEVIEVGGKADSTRFTTFKDAGSLVK